MGDKVEDHKGAESKKINLEEYMRRNLCGNDMQYCIMVVSVRWIYIIFLRMSKESHRARKGWRESLDLC